MSMDQKLAPCSNGEFLRYFLWLGTFGFGGPIALVGYMQRDLVEKKRWISHDDYIQGLAFTKLCPGPLATQLAIYFGWLRGGFLGASLVGAAFVLPSFCMVVVIAAFYLHNASVLWIHEAFYGVGASVVAIIIRSAIKLAQITCKNETLLWVIFVINAAVTPMIASEIVWVFLLSGLVWMYIKAPPTFFKRHLQCIIVPSSLITGLHGVATVSTLVKIGLYFAWAGAFVFGSGLAIVPFLHGGVVEQYAWLTEAQFLDAVSVGLITPGPAVITSAFIGYLVAGLLGATVATIAIFLPCFLFVVLLASFYRRLVENRSVNAFVIGVTAAVVGSIAGSAVILGRQALFDTKTVTLCAIATAAIFLFKKIPEPLVIIAAGVGGYFWR